MKKPIVLYDGVCSLCQNTVKFILRTDRKGIIQFASLQSEIGKKIINESPLHEQRIDSIVYVNNGRVSIKSTAALNIVKHLSGFWTILYLFIIVPRPIRDYLYDIIAKNRYRWFGKEETCLMPKPEWKNRFIDNNHN